jgi:type I restriction enzyme S subunit
MEKIKPYTKYKPSGVSWLGEIPEHWDIKRIKYVFKEQDKRSEDGLEDLLSVSHYTGVTKKSDRYKLGEEISNAKTLIGYKKVTEGDLVMNIMLAWNGSLGISRFNGITSPAYSVFKSMIGGERFFGYLFRTKKAQQEFKKQSTGIIDSRLRLYPDKFFNIKTIIPPSEEQTAIANFLDYKTAKIDRFIRKKKQLIKLLNEQKAGIINHAVTKGLDANAKMKPSGIEWLGDIPEHWEVRKLKYVADCFPSNVDKHTKEGEKQVRLCNYTDVYKNDFITNDMNLMLATATDQQIEKFRLKVGDVIMTKDSETANDIAVPTCVKEELENVVCGYHLSVLRPSEKLIGEYLFRVLQCKPINIQFEVCSNGVTRVGLGVYDMKKAKTPVPPIEEQKQIVSHIEKETLKLNKAIATIEKEIALVQEYRTALIAEAVTGKIDVREYKVPILGEEDLVYEEIEDEMDMVAEDGDGME